MGDMNDDRREDLVKVAETATAAAVAAGGATGSAEVAAAAGFLAALPQLVGSVIPGVLGRQQRRVDKWWAIVTRGEDGSDEEFERDLHERLAKDDERLHATVMASLRTLLDTLERAMLIPLARLTRNYLKEHRGPDLFFRGVADVLSRISREELSSLRDVLDTAIKRASYGGSDDFIKLVHRSAKHIDDPDELLQARPTKGQDVWSVGYFDYDMKKDARFIPVMAVPHAREVFSLLKAARLADDFRGGYGESAGPDDLLIQEDVARRFRILL